MGSLAEAFDLRADERYDRTALIGEAIGVAVEGIGAAEASAESRKLALQYASEPERYIVEKLGWTPWAGTGDGAPGQREVIAAYTRAIRQQLERRAYENGELVEDQLQVWRPGEVIQNWIRLEAGHTVGKCVEASERLVLSDGRRVPAGELVGQSFRLLTLVDGKPRSVSARAEFNATEEVFELVTDTGRRIVRNAHHPVWTTEPEFTPGRHPCIPEGAWTGVAAVRPGQLVAVAEALPSFGTRDMLTETEIKLLAYLIGDGGYTRRLIAFSQAPGPQLEEFRALAREYGCAVDQISAYDWKVVGAGRRKVNHNPVMQLLRAHDLMGKHSRDKRVPEAVFGLTRESQRLFLNRLFSTDGWACVDRNGVPEIGFCSASEGLVHDVQDLLQRFGVHGRITARPKVNAWVLYIRDRCDLMAFVEEIGIFGKEAGVEAVRAAAEPTRDRKRAAIARRPDRPRWCHKNAPAGTRWEKAVAVRSIGVRDTIAVEVPEHHTFLTAFWEHNTKLASGLANHFFDCFPPAIVYSFAPTWEQIHDLLWKEIGADREGKGLPGRVLDTCEIKLRKNHFAKGRATNNAGGKGTERVQGQHGAYLMFILDEAEGVAGFVYDAIQSMSSGGVVIVLMLANPRTRTSRFHKIRARSNVRTFRMSCIHHPNVIAGREVVPNAVRREYVETMVEEHCDVVAEHSEDDHTFTLPFPVHTAERIHPPGTIFLPDAEFLFRVLGIAPANIADNTFVPVGRYEAATKRRAEGTGTEARIGVDVARYGKDAGTLYIRHGMRLWRGAQLRKQDTNAYAGAIKEAARALAAVGVTSLHLRIDAGGGFGGGVADRVKDDAELRRTFRDFRVFEVDFGGTPHDPEAYADLATEMMAEAAETLKGATLVSPPNELEQDLTERTYRWVNLRGVAVKRLESKEDFRKPTRTGRSPDDGDGFILAAAPDFVFKRREIDPSAFAVSTKK